MSVVHPPNSTLEQNGITSPAPRRDSFLKCFPLTLHQFLHIFILNGLGPAILNGGINFGLATLMYKNSSNTTKTWSLPSSLAGDAAVTIMIQGTLTWVIAGLLTRIDERHNRVKSIQVLAPTKPHWVCQVFFGGNFDILTEQESSRFIRLLLTFIRGLLFAGSTGLFFWPLSIAYLLVTFGNSGTIPNWPTPQIYKGVLGAVLGLLTTPAVVILALMEAHRLQYTTRVAHVPTHDSQANDGADVQTDSQKGSQALTKPSVLEAMPHSSVDMPQK